MPNESYVWTPPGVTSTQAKEFLAIRSGLPRYIRPEIAGWIKQSANPNNLAPLNDLLRFQTVCRTNLGFVPGEYILWSTFIELMIKHWDEKILTNYIHFVLSEINVYRVEPPAIQGRAQSLEEILVNGGSSWAVGWVQGRYGLLERIPAGVVDAVEGVVTAAGHASGLLRQAWDMAFGATKNPSHAYFDAVKAVEVLSCPLFSPNDREPTLGKDINVLRNKPESFSFVMTGSKRSTPVEKLLSMMELLWHSQTDRHGRGDYQDVSEAEAQAAVLLASTLVGWFSQEYVQRVS